MERIKNESKIFDDGMLKLAKIFEMRTKIVRNVNNPMWISLSKSILNWRKFEMFQLNAYNMNYF